MKTTAVLWFSLFCFGINLQQGFGQCAPQLYFRDDDNDGVGAGTHGEIGDVYAEYYASGNNGAPVQHTNVYMGCNPPSGCITTRYVDLSDDNPLISEIPPRPHFYDGDRDGFGANSPTRIQSFVTIDYVARNTDCDDTDPNIKPNNVWYQDIDGDGTGGSNTREACYAPVGYVSSTGDVCDNDPAIQVEHTWYQDADGDGTGGSSIQLACTQPSGYVSTTGDALNTYLGSAFRPGFQPIYFCLKLRCSSLAGNKINRIFAPHLTSDENRVC